MGGLGHYLEEEGVATTQISLIRMHTEIIKPPRALWVPFELGRPLGSPNDPEFQRRVLLAALRLLEAPQGPILDDFPEDAPSSGPGRGPVSCPIDAGDLGPAKEEQETLPNAFRRELTLLRPWYDTACRNRGRTTAQASGLDPDTLAKFLCRFLEDTKTPSPRAEFSAAAMLKLAAEDLKAFYQEAVSAQPGSSADSRALSDWFWGETRAGQILAALRQVCLESGDPKLELLGTLLLVPRSQLHRLRNTSHPSPE